MLPILLGMLPCGAQQPLCVGSHKMPKSSDSVAYINIRGGGVKTYPLQGRNSRGIREGARNRKVCPQRVGLTVVRRTASEPEAGPAQGGAVAVCTRHRTPVGWLTLWALVLI